MISYRVVVLGEGGVGKSAMTIKLSLNHFIENYDPTIEDSYRKHAVIDGEPCLIEILDTAGQEEYTALRDQWIREGEAFLLVYSITSRQTYERVKRFHTQITRVKDGFDIPIVLVGNKCDKVNEREVGKEEGQALADQLQCDFVETSAKTSFNLELAYYSAVRLIRKQRDGPMGSPKKEKKRKCTIL